jgi:hypothetical protein
MLFYTVAVGLLFDLAALVRKLLYAGKVLTLLVDCAFSLLAVMLLAATWLHVNYLDFRMYALMGAASGAALYALTVRPLLRLVVVRPLIFLGRRMKRVAGAKIVRKIFK